MKVNIRTEEGVYAIEALPVSLCVAGRYVAHHCILTWKDEELCGDQEQVAELDDWAITEFHSGYQLDSGRDLVAAIDKAEQKVRKNSKAYTLWLVVSAWLFKGWINSNKTWRQLLKENDEAWGLTDAK